MRYRKGEFSLGRTMFFSEAQKILFQGNGNRIEQRYARSIDLSYWQFTHPDPRYIEGTCECCGKPLPEDTGWKCFDCNFQLEDYKSGLKVYFDMNPSSYMYYEVIGGGKKCA